MEKPIIILGGGILGSLLAWKMKDTFPDLNFLLYEETSSLGGGGYCPFRETDCGLAFRWIKPLVSKSWSHYQVKLSNLDKWITSPYHLIQSKDFHEKVSVKLGERLKLNNNLNPEFALKESNFVIDTRTNYFFRTTGFRKIISLHFETSDGHHLKAPVILDRSVDQKEKGRTVSYYPISERELLMTDTWLSYAPKIDVDEMRTLICETIHNKGWRINKIIREEYDVTKIPVLAPVLREEARVINLGGFIHDTTGCSISMAAELIERILATSFRLGELKKVVREYRSECEPNKKFLRGLNKQYLSGEGACLYEAIYSQPDQVIERYSRGMMNMTDRSRISILKSHFKVASLINTAVPRQLHPRVHYFAQKLNRLRKPYRN
jgi:lycopene beta-cyclase